MLPDGSSPGEISSDAEYVGRRLILEGRFLDWDEMQEEDVDHLLEEKANAAPTEEVDIDPVEENRDPRTVSRIEELTSICNGVGSQFLRDFFSDTSYLVHRYATLVNESGEQERYEEIDSYMNEFNRVMGNPQLSETDVNRFLDLTAEITDDFWNLSEKTDAGYETWILGYEERYTNPSDKGRRNDQSLAEELLNQ